MVLVSLFPFGFLILGSFKETFEILTIAPTLLPRDGFDFDNYAALFEFWPFLRNMLNSFIVSTCVTFFVVLTSILVGYTMAKYEFPGKRVIFVIIIATMMVPFEARLVPTYVMFREFGLINTYLGLIIPGMVTAFGVFLIRQFALSSVPDELIEAARLDGASEFQILRRIAVPMLRPAMISLALLTFINSWNDFLWPLVVVTSSDMFTVSVALKSLADPSLVVDYGMVFAACTVAALPVLVVYLIFNRTITRSVIQGAGREL